MGQWPFLDDYCQQYRDIDLNFYNNLVNYVSACGIPGHLERSRCRIAHHSNVTACMDNNFFTWDDFVESFGREMRIAGEVYDGMVKNGLKDGSLLQFDFTFVSDKKCKLERLREFILAHYPYTIENLKQIGENWELSGMSDDIAVTADTLMFWALDMAKRGYELDARFDAYGASIDANATRFPDLSEAREDFWFDHALDQYNAGNLSGALISWSHVIAINPRNADAWYSRAMVKDELHTWKAALRDYDEALRIAPEFMGALINRGSLKANNGDHQGAISDYEAVIEHASDTDQKAMAYFNRGNSKLQLSDKAGACGDWKKARDLGADYAGARIREHCH